MKELDERIQSLEAERIRPAKNSQAVSGKEIGRHVIDVMLEKKALDITVMHVSEISTVTDYFVLCTGESPRQLKAIADGIRETVRKKTGERAWHVEGYTQREWILLDYVDIVIHIFSDEKRAYYDLERLWADAPTENLGPDVESAELFSS